MQLNKDNTYYLGIDIGGTAAKMGIVSNDGDILFKKSYDVCFNQYEAPILETVKDSIKMFINECEIEINQLSGIGVSATGQIDSEAGAVIGVGGNIRNWKGAQIKRELEQLYSLPVSVVNDANCMVIGESWIGCAKGQQNVIGITIGTGVGGGIIVDSKILLGRQGIAGELGHFVIYGDGKRCTCGHVGCYEQYASMTALIKEVFEHAEVCGLENEEVNGLMIFEKMDKNTELKKIVDQWICDIGKGLVGLTHIFNPEMIVIGGAVSVQEEKFIQPIRDYLYQHAMENFTKNLIIQAAVLGNDAGLVGAVYYNLNTK